MQDLFRRSAAGGSGGIEDDARAPRRQELFESACAADKTWGPGDAGADTTAEFHASITIRRQRERRQNAASKAAKHPPVWDCLNLGVKRMCEAWKIEASNRGRPVVRERVYTLQRRAARFSPSGAAAHPARGGLNGPEWRPFVRRHGAVALVYTAAQAQASRICSACLSRSFSNPCLGWRRGIEFEVVALQATMADAYDSPHIVAGSLGLFRDEDESSLKKQMDLAHRALRWRWLLLDEISMVSG